MYNELITITGTISGEEVTLMNDGTVIVPIYNMVEDDDFGGTPIHTKHGPATFLRMSMQKYHRQFVGKHGLIKIVTPQDMRELPSTEVPGFGTGDVIDYFIVANNEPVACPSLEELADMHKIIEQVTIALGGPTVVPGHKVIQDDICMPLR